MLAALPFLPPTALRGTTPALAAAAALAARLYLPLAATVPPAAHPGLAYLEALATAAGGGDAARGALVLAVLGGLALAALLPRRRAPTYLLSLVVYRPPAHLRVSRAKYIDISRRCGAFDEAAMAFQEKMAAAGGLGDATYLPPAMHASPPAPSLGAAREEAEMVLRGTVTDALETAGITPAQVDAVIVNCSLFCPTPSLAAMVVRLWGLRPDVITYNLGGQGCSAGVIAVGLAQEVLQAHPGFRVLVVSTENITQNW
jgi:3-ketoacyl-CoA synthase